MKRNDTMRSADLRLLTKAEACQELRLSLSTLNQCIAAPVRREPRGRRHREFLRCWTTSTGERRSPAIDDGRCIVADTGPSITTTY